MHYPIEDIEGIGPAYGQKLATAKIKSTGHLLKQCATRAGRKSTAEATGLSESLLLKWTNLADMMRISGIGPQYAELLEAAGVDTVKELAQRKADNLAEKMAEVNKAKKLTRTVPAASMLMKWIDTAKTTEPGISY